MNDKVHAKVFRVDGTVREVRPVDLYRGFTLEELYKLLDCELVQVRYLDEGSIMIMDEEGKCVGKPVNVKATQIYNIYYVSDVVVGDVMICPSDMFK